MIKISIVTICFNNERDIRLTLESVIKQTYPNIEYIVVDGASKDNSLSIINEYKSKISKIISEPDHGMYEALNKGFKIATGDVIGMIHAGDRLFDNDVIAKIADFYENNDVDISYGNSYIVDGSDKPKRINISPDFSHRLIRKGWMPSHQSIYCKRNVFDTVGYYRTDFGGSGDYEWFVRTFGKYGSDFKIMRINEFIIRFSLGGQSTKSYSVKLSKKHFENVKRCWTINDLRPPLGIVWKMFARKIRQFMLARFKNI